MGKFLEITPQLKDRDVGQLTASSCRSSNKIITPGKHQKQTFNVFNNWQNEAWRGTSNALFSPC